MNVTFLVGLVACTGAGTPSSTDAPGADPDAPGETGPANIGGDTAETGTADTADTADTGQAPETWPKACKSLYDQDTLQTFDLNFVDGNWSALQNNCSQGSQAYVRATLTWNGETVEAEVRLKGNWTWNCSKLQFVVSFNEVDPDARFHGLRKLVFDAPWYDWTLLHERLAFPLFERLDLPYSCVNNARVNVNGSYYGIYANTERVDHEYLERNFEDPSGNLYQAASELKTNEDIGDTSDLDALLAATTAAELATIIDLDEATSEWAAEAMIPALDNYWAGVEINYYVYDNPGHGFTWLPYDMDLTFGDSYYGDGTPIWSGVVSADPIYWEHTGWRKEVLFETVISDPDWCEVYVEKVAEARAAYVPAQMQADIADWDAQIWSSWEEDPARGISMGQHDAAVAALSSFVQDRADYVDAWLAAGNHCPATW